MNNQKGIVTVALIAIIAGVVIIGGGLTWYFLSQGAGDDYNTNISNTNSAINVNQSANMNSTVSEGNKKPATGKYATVDSTYATVSAMEFSTTKIHEPGYYMLGHASVKTTNEASAVAAENVSINNMSAMGSCETVSNTPNLGTWISSSQTQISAVEVRIECRPGVTYNEDDILETMGSHNSSNILQYANHTPASINRTLSFNIVVTYKDGTTASTPIMVSMDPSKLMVNDFGAGMITAPGTNF
ncbi:MAG: hypothetical protein WC693_04850 [Patescibacteria group bacterium]|jgi:hypothetical protein